MKNKNDKKSVAFLVCIFSGIFLGLFVKLFVFDIVAVSGASMEPTIKNGQKAFVNRLAYGIPVPFRSSFIVQWAFPADGDLVTYLHNDKIVVKRCAAVGGTVLEFSDESGYNLFLGGNRIPLTKSQFDMMKNYGSVPEGYILALGDNYSESVDSRAYGFVSVKNVTGKIIGK